jgi:hypothetical protein
MRSQGTRQQLVAIGIKDKLLRHGLRLRIISQIAFWIGDALLHTALIAAGERHAGAAGKHQLRDLVFEARFEDVHRAAEIALEVMFPRPPNARDCCDVKDRIHAFRRHKQRRQVPHITRGNLRAERRQLRHIPPHQRANLVAAGEQLLDDIAPEEAIGPGDECVHDSVAF